MSLIERLLDTEEAIRLAILENVKPEVERVVLNKRVRISDMKPPMIWVLPEESNIIDSALALSEIWNLTYWIIAITKGYKDTDKLLRDAERLAIKASAGLLKDRTLNGRVEDITRIGWAPGDSRIMENDESLFGAGIRVRIKLINKGVE